MRIGILQTGHAPDALIGTTGDYDQMFRDLLAGHGFEFETCAVVDGAFPAGADACDGWLITGSRHGAYENHAWIAPLEALIRAIRDSGRPMIGVCFGHQIIARALGGTVEKFAGGWAIGRTEYDFGDRRVALNAWHQDQVTRPPEGAVVAATNAFCKNAALAYGDSIWTLQPHPEYDTGFIEGLIRTRGRGVVPEATLKAARETLNGPLGNADIGAFMAGFFKKARVR